ncbi:hypothetical protein IQ287_35500 [Burkholderia sp. R-69927]|nr:hypothetical protein [Burkholderia sp. R-69927]
MLVGDDPIVQGIKLPHDHTGLVAEPSAAVGFAAMLESPRSFKGARVGIILRWRPDRLLQMKNWL